MSKGRVITSLAFVRAIMLISLASLSAMALARGFGVVNDWRFTHYLFSYEHEFLKRALVGEILRWIVEDVDYQIVVLVSTVALLILAIVLFFIFTLPLIRNRSLHGNFLFAAVALASPATLQHFAFDLGRFDLFNLLITLSMIYAIKHLKLISAAFFVYLSMTISLLVHEASFFMYLPMVLAYWFYRDRSRTAFVLQTLFVALSVGLTFIISRWGLSTISSLDHHATTLSDKYGDRVLLESVAVVHKGELLQNIRYTYWRTINIDHFTDHLIMFSVLSPLFVLLFKCIHSLSSVTDTRIFLVLAASTSPLLLYPLGLDHFRWWALAITNLVIMLAILNDNNLHIQNLVAGVFERNRIICWVSIFTGLAVGPLGIVKPFDFL